MVGDPYLQVANLKSPHHSYAKATLPKFWLQAVQKSIVKSSPDSQILLKASQTWNTKSNPVILPKLCREVIIREPAVLAPGLDDSPPVPLAKGWNLTVVNQDWLDAIHIHVRIVSTVMSICI